MNFLTGIALGSVVTTLFCFLMTVSMVSDIDKENRVLRIVNQETLADMKAHSTEYATAAEIHEYLTTYLPTTPAPKTAVITPSH